MTRSPEDPGRHTSSTPRPRRALRPGDLLPEFDAPSTAHQTLGKDRFVGRVPMLVVVARAVGDLRSVACDLHEVSVEMGRERIQLLLIADSPIVDLEQLTKGTSTTALADPAGSIADLLGAEEGTLTVLAVARDGRIAATGTLDHASNLTRYLPALTERVSDPPRPEREPCGDYPG